MPVEEFVKVERSFKPVATLRDLPRKSKQACGNLVAGGDPSAQRTKNMRLNCLGVLFRTFYSGRRDSRANERREVLHCYHVRNRCC